MSSYKVAPLKKIEIRMLTENFLRKYFPDHLVSPGELDTEELLDQALFDYSGYTLLLVDTKDLRTDAKVVPSDLTIEFPLKNWLKMIKGDHRQRFTVAHEGAHLILNHLSQIDSNTVSFTRTYNAKLKPYENSEWQAEYGGSCLLMPPATLIPFVNKLRRSGRTDREILLNISRVYNVSVDAARLAIKKEDEFSSEFRLRFKNKLDFQKKGWQ